VILPLLVFPGSATVPLPPCSTQGILKGEVSLFRDLLFHWFGLVCFAKNTIIVSCHTAESKPVKQEVNVIVILPSLVFPGSATVPLLLCSTQGILKVKYHCTVDLLFDWFGLVCFANKNKFCQLSHI
jgi:hypothetical protein